jgi:hypothetical protein
MDAPIKTVVTFKSSAFNMPEPKKYFINPSCFGDDLAIWLIDQLRGKGYEVSDAPGQEDFGWYSTFRVSEIEHCFVIGHRRTKTTRKAYGLVGSNAAEVSYRQ